MQYYQLLLKNRDDRAYLDRMVTQALSLEDESNVSDVAPLPQSELEVVGSAN